MYRPLPDCCTIKPSSIEGLGLFATKLIPSGTDLGMTHIFDNRLPDGIIRLPLGGFFNHSEAPNCKIEEKFYSGRIHIHHLRLVALNDIQEGEEMTAYYTLYQPK